MKEIKINKQKLFILLASVGAFSLVTGVAYSYFSADLQGIRENSINSNTLIFEYSEPTNELMLEGNQGMTEDDGKSQNEYFEFTITAKSNGEQEVPYYIYLEKLEVENDLPEEKINLYLTSVKEDIETQVVAPTPLSSLSGTDKKLIHNTSFILDGDTLTEETHKYRLRLWMDETFEIKDLVESGENDNEEQTEILNEHSIKYRINITTLEEQA